MSAPTHMQPVSTRTVVTCAVLAGLVAGIALAIVGYLGTRPFSDLAGANAEPVARYGPFPASSAPQAPHTPPSLTELPFVHGKSAPTLRHP